MTSPYLANPVTNLVVQSRVRWQSDTNIVREFFEGEYFENPQPNTFFEASKFWQNFSADTYVEPRLNNFLDTIERLPEVRLTGPAAAVVEHARLLRERQLGGVSTNTCSRRPTR